MKHLRSFALGFTGVVLFVAGWASHRAGDSLNFGTRVALEPSSAHGDRVASPRAWRSAVGFEPAISETDSSRTNSSPAHIGGTLRHLLRESNNLRRAQLLSGLVDSLDLDGLRSAAEIAKTFSDFDRTEMHCAIAARLAEVDPKAAADFALSEAGYLNGGRIMESALSAWVAINPDEAIAWSKNLSDPDRRNSTLEKLITVLARKDPEKAMGLLTEQSPSVKGSLMHHVASHWAQRDPQGCAEMAKDLNGVEAERVIGVATWVWAQDDPTTALAWAKALTDPARRGAAVASTFRAWAEAAPDAARAEALALPAGDVRDRALAAVAHACSKSGGDEGFHLVEEIRDSSVREQGLTGMVMGYLNSGNPDGAAAAAAVMSPGDSRDFAIRWTAEGLAKKDISRALEWSAALPHDQARKDAIAWVIRKWGETEPAAALGWVLAHEPPAGDGSDVRGLVRGWAARDETEALNWMKSLPDGQSKDILLAEAIRGLSGGDALGVAAMLETFSASTQAAAAGEVAKNWVQVDASATAQWASRLRDDTAAANACRLVAEAWGQRDVNATATWIESLPMGIKRDAAVSAFCRVVVTSDAERALAWASSINDPARRVEAAEQLAKTWIARNSDQAVRWIDAADWLPLEVKARLRAFKP